MNQAVGQYLAHSIKETETIGILMEHLPKYDFENMLYNFEIISPDEEENDNEK